MCVFARAHETVSLTGRVAAVSGGEKVVKDRGKVLAASVTHAGRGDTTEGVYGRARVRAQIATPHVGTTSGYQVAEGWSQECA